MSQAIEPFSELPNQSAIKISLDNSQNRNLKGDAHNLLAQKNIIAQKPIAQKRPEQIKLSTMSMNSSRMRKSGSQLRYEVDHYVFNEENPDEAVFGGKTN